MPQAPDVSVIIPVFNTASSLDACLGSVVAQTGTAGGLTIEVVAIDDGSSDGSGEVLDRWAERHPEITVIHQENSGWAGAPRNRGLEAARGRFVFFVDSDDELLDGALAELVAFADAHGSDVVVPRLASATGRNTHDVVFAETHVEAPINLLVKTNYPFKLVRRSLAADHHLRFPEEKVRLEDAQFVFAAYAASRRTSILADRAYYLLNARPEGGNISRTGIDPWNHIIGVRRSLEALTGGPWDPEERREAEADFFRRVVLVRYDDRFQGRSRANQAAWVRANATLADLVTDDTARRYFRPRNRARLAGLRDGNIQAMLAVSRYRRGRLGFADLVSARLGARGLRIQGSFTPVFNHEGCRSLGIRLTTGDGRSHDIAAAFTPGAERPLLGTRRWHFDATVPLRSLVAARRSRIHVVATDDSDGTTRARLFTAAPVDLRSAALPGVVVRVTSTSVGGAGLRVGIASAPFRTAMRAARPLVSAVRRLRNSSPKVMK